MWAIIQFYYCVANLNKDIRFNSVLLEWDYFVTDKGKIDKSYPSQQIIIESFEIRAYFESFIFIGNFDIDIGIENSNHDK